MRMYIFCFGFEPRCKRVPSGALPTWAMHEHSNWLCLESWWSVSCSYPKVHRQIKRFRSTRPCSLYPDLQKGKESSFLLLLITWNNPTESGLYHGGDFPFSFICWATWFLSFSSNLLGLSCSLEQQWKVRDDWILQASSKFTAFWDSSQDFQVLDLLASHMCILLGSWCFQNVVVFLPVLFIRVQEGKQRCYQT